MIKLDYGNWIEKAKELFGSNSYDWKFKCPSCGHIQSINSLIKHNPSLEAKDIQDAIYFNCEGRYTENYGCDWTLGGLFHIHKVEITINGKTHPVFEFGE